MHYPPLCQRYPVTCTTITLLLPEMPCDLHYTPFGQQGAPRHALPHCCVTTGTFRQSHDGLVQKVSMAALFVFFTSSLSLGRGADTGTPEHRSLSCSCGGQVSTTRPASCGRQHASTAPREHHSSKRIARTMPHTQHTAMHCHDGRCARVS